MLHDSVAAIAAAERDGALRAQYFLHLRCEVAHETIVATVERMIDHPLVRLVSLMDHTPGQRQFASIEKYYEYYQGKFGYSDAEMKSYIDRKTDLNRRFSDVNRRTLAGLGRARGLPLASHDDATLAHVDEAIGYGTVIAEFPTTDEAGAAAHRAGMAVVMGAPNVVRGGSHSGNISARELAADGFLDILSSDYAPIARLHATFCCTRRSPCRCRRRSRPRPPTRLERSASTIAGRSHRAGAPIWCGSGGAATCRSHARSGDKANGWSDGLIAKEDRDELRRRDLRDS
jgi:alpha-D-ribose 1-methylphosphonate 5-triphosphate diphosphatase